MKNIKNQKGITLVALVVTIIILIILAGVSINLVLGENGIITLAKKAKENMELAEKEDLTKLNGLDKEMGNQLDDKNPNEANIVIYGDKLQESLPINLSAKVTHIDNESGINISSCKYVINTISNNIGTDSKDYTRRNI